MLFKINLPLKSLNAHWLRFNCHDPKSKQPNTGQRTIDAETIPLDLKVAGFRMADGSIKIKWNDSAQQTDSVVPIDFIINNYPSCERLALNQPVQRYKSIKVKKLKSGFFQ